MDWEVVKISGESKSRLQPCASVGFGRLYFNVAACELLDKCDDYEYVELLKGRIRNKLCIGVRFLKKNEKTQDSILISKRRKGSAKKIIGIAINNKKMMEELFGLNRPHQL